MPRLQLDETGQLIVGTEDCRILVLDPSGTAVDRAIVLPAGAEGHILASMQHHAAAPAMLHAAVVLHESNHSTAAPCGYAPSSAALHK